MSVLAAAETRASFQYLAGWEVALFYILIAPTLAVFGLGVWTLVRKYLEGRGATRLDRSARRVWSTITTIAAHMGIGRGDLGVGIGHLAVFYGFIVLFALSLILMVNDDVTRLLFHWQFFRAQFYLGFSLVGDLFGVALLGGLAFMIVRRAILRPRRLDYARRDGFGSAYGRTRYVVGDWLFLGWLFLLGAGGLALEGLRIAATNPAFEKWSPAGWVIAQAFRAAGLEGAAVRVPQHVLWWIHAGAALAFVAAIPFTKALHMLTAPAALTVKDEYAGKRLLPVPAQATAEEVGYSLIGDLSPVHLLDLDACTKCGRCHEACPATASGYPLSPRDLVLDLREYAEGSRGIRAAMHVRPLYASAKSVLGDPIHAETIWSCTACLSCVEVCPNGIEHVSMINAFRRRLVETGDLDTQLQSTLQRIADSGNSLGEARRKRARWTQDISPPPKDIRREPAEYLWFVGDYASFDERVQDSTRDLARVLQAAEVDFGILFEAEKTAGCDVRRVGEEGLWLTLAEENIAAMGACEFETLLTSDPHSYHTLRNEYPELGVEWSVLHHTELLLRLIRAGRLRPRRTLSYRATYHDPCMLGRYNSLYDPPRQLLAELGVELVEMPRNREDSFCCGAGGGLIWQKDTDRAGLPRASEQRIAEAVQVGPLDVFVVACPKDLKMYEDALKTSGHEGEFVIREISEIVAEAVG